MTTDHTDDLLELRYVLKRHNEESRWIRRRILELVDEGVTQRAIAQRLDITVTTLSYWVKVARREREDAAETTARAERGE
ncbi:helix-turn-helix domain-containing protein [Curtobacterium flaccumfaciens]|uniref:helix-turn-helix domain-containing protein n=1 Tax=Curtobacterium flaccumfaciens TaxID=2035 RepID=UPI003445402B